MSFLLDRSLPQKTMMSTVDKTEPLSEDEEYEDQDVYEEQQVADDTTTPFISVIENLNQTSPELSGPPEKKPRTSNEDTTVTEACNVITSSTPNPVISECLSFANFIACKLRSYSPRTRNAVQHAISDILFKADQGHYDQ